VLDEGFVADCPYAPEAILFEEIVEIDREAGRLVARMPTHDRLPFTALQRAHPRRHPPHVSGAVMIHLTGMLGFAHAYCVLGLRHADGWIDHVSCVVFPSSVRLPATAHSVSAAPSERNRASTQPTGCTSWKL
jgi:hypothetical protein